MTKLLNDDGSASMATALLMSHHAFRRDIARFAIALRGLGSPGAAQVAGLQGEWAHYRAALHGQRCVPRRLDEERFVFGHENLSESLHSLLR